MNLKNWKEETDLITDSLWIIGERDKSFGHSNVYHGNFIPQIPRQFIKRFTNEGDLVVDVFNGSGTTLIECRELKRFGIGVELQPHIVELATDIILGSKDDLMAELRPKLEDFNLKIIQGDSSSQKVHDEIAEITNKLNKKIKLLILHPPYWDIIKFSSDKEDLSNAESVEKFNEMMGKIVDNFLDLIEKNGHIVLVIADKYQNSQWVPLGFYCMQEILKRPEIILKSTIVKNMAGNRAKLNQEALWRYRALAGGYYIFKHEYIFLFKKIK
jgi:DNA modification methylase